jgi:hypothetical protein
VLFVFSCLQGKLAVGMVMLAIEGQVVFGRPFDDVMDVVKAAPRPMKMTFVPSPDNQVTFIPILQPVYTFFYK